LKQRRHRDFSPVSSLEQPQRVDIGGFAEACKRLKLEETLTVRVVFDDTGKEVLEYLVQVIRYHVTDDVGLVGIGTDLKLYERFVSPAWVKDRYRAVRRIETILDGLNRESAPKQPGGGAVDRNGR
jgi:hypothetical protein